MTRNRASWFNTLAGLLACGTIWLVQTSGTASAQVRSLTLRGMRSVEPSAGSQSGRSPLPGLSTGEQPSVTPELSLAFGIYTFPGTVGTFTADVNKAGHSVGGYGPNGNFNLPSNHGYVLKGSKFTTLDYPGAGWTQPNAINDAGVIVGGWGATFYDEHGFKLVGTTYTSIDYPGSIGTAAAGINKHGDIVGVWFSTTNPDYSRGFLLKGGVFTSIDYPGALATIAWSINSSGEIAGAYLDSSYNDHGFLLQSGTYTTFDYPGYSQNFVAGINDSGVIAGSYGDLVTINGVQYQWEHSYVYQSGTFTTFDPPFGPPAADQIWHLNNYGVISGFFVDKLSTDYGFEATIGP